jgi:16S rRNA (uracil1498-N3)-methyltransferase
MHLFYTPEIDLSDTYELSEEESKHAVRVLRLKMGDEIWLTNGKGSLFQAKLLNEHPKRCNIQITKRLTEQGKRDYRLHIAVAPTKNNTRFEWFLEKATEIGIDEITPLICEHSERNVVKTDRLNKVITAAVKQSLKAYHPQLNATQKFTEFIETHRSETQLLAWCKASPDHRIENQVNAGEDVILIIGPEGGFSETEIELAKKKGVSFVSISSSRLRTETAALVACHSIAFINKM